MMFTVVHTSILGVRKMDNQQQTCTIYSRQSSVERSRFLIISHTACAMALHLMGACMSFDAVPICTCQGLIQVHGREGGGGGVSISAGFSNVRGEADAFHASAACLMPGPASTG